MKRIRLNRGNLYPTGQPKQTGYKDTYFEDTCSECGQIIRKKESNMSVPSKDGIKKFDWDCGLKVNKTHRSEK